MNELSNIVPLLYTEKLQETIDFYVKRLGFTLGDYSDEPGWAALFFGQSQILASLPGTRIPFGKTQAGDAFNIHVKDIDALWLKLKNSTNICRELETFPWGVREFAVYDNNGYNVIFGQWTGRK